MATKDDDDNDNEFEVTREEPQEDAREVEIAEDDDEDEDPAPPRQPDGSVRRAKKRKRLEDIVEERIARAREEWDRQHQETLRTVVSSIPRNEPPQAQPEKDPLEVEIELKRRERLAVLAEFNALPEADQRARIKEYQDRAYQLEREERDLGVDLRLKQREQRQQQHAPQSPDPATQAVFSKYSADYYDVMRDPAAFQVARAEFIKLTTREGKSNQDPATLEESLKRARRWLTGNMPRPRSDGSAERARLSGVPRGASDGGSNEPRRYTITKNEEKMATSLYSNLPKEKAIAKWLKEVKYAKDA